MVRGWERTKNRSGEDLDMTMLKSGAKLSCFLSLWLAVCVCAVDANAQAAPLFSFSDDFSAAALKPQWSSTTTSLAVNVAPSGQRFLGRAGGNDGLSNDTVKLTLTGVPATGVVVVEFNLFIIRSMDGNEPFVFNANNVRYTAAFTFSNNKIAFHTEVTQSYPWPGSPPLTGAQGVETLHYNVLNPTHYSDSTYHLRFQIPYAAQAPTLNAIYFEFSMFGLQDITDESWGLDNVSAVIRQSTTQ
jgi:hypothetical protein